MKLKLKQVLFCDWKPTAVAGRGSSSLARGLIDEKTHDLFYEDGLIFMRGHPGSPDGTETRILSAQGCMMILADSEQVEFPREQRKLKAATTA